MSINKGLSLIEKMATFSVVVSEGSFINAAKSLGQSPSSVSRNIAALEDSLGVSLLKRTTRRLQLTNEGLEVFQRCNDIYKLSQEVLSITENKLVTDKGDIKIVAPKAIAYSLIHPHISEFIKAYPDINIHLIFEDKAMDLIEHKIDVLFKVTDSPPLGVIGKKVIPVKHMLVASPHYAQTYGLPKHPKELVDHRCICLGEDLRDSKWRFSKNSKKLSVDVNGQYMANNTKARLDAVKQDIGIGSLPYFIAKQDIDDGNVIDVLPDWDFHTSYSGELWLLYGTSKYIPTRIKIFVKFITERIRQSIDS